jgi:hypothetical protein
MMSWEMNNPKRSNIPQAIPRFGQRKPKRKRWIARSNALNDQSLPVIHVIHFTTDTCRCACAASPFSNWPFIYANEWFGETNERSGGTDGPFGGTSGWSGGTDGPFGGTRGWSGETDGRFGGTRGRSGGTDGRFGGTNAPFAGMDGRFGETDEPSGGKDQRSVGMAERPGGTREPFARKKSPRERLRVRRIREKGRLSRSDAGAVPKDGPSARGEWEESGWAHRAKSGSLLARSIGAHSGQGDRAIPRSLDCPASSR